MNNPIVFNQNNETMDEMNFYKTYFERELSRRYELDKLINIPITLISLNTGIII